jgi:hypothetical protein
MAQRIRLTDKVNDVFNNVFSNYGALDLGEDIARLSKIQGIINDTYQRKGEFKFSSWEQSLEKIEKVEGEFDYERSKRVAAEVKGLMLEYFGLKTGTRRIKSQDYVEYKLRSGKETLERIADETYSSPSPIDWGFDKASELYPTVEPAAKPRRFGFKKLLYKATAAVAGTAMVYATIGGHFPGKGYFTKPNDAEAAVAKKLKNEDAAHVKGKADYSLFLHENGDKISITSLYRGSDAVLSVMKNGKWRIVEQGVEMEIEGVTQVKFYEKASGKPFSSFVLKPKTIENVVAETPARMPNRDYRVIAQAQDEAQPINADSSKDYAKAPAATPSSPAVTTGPIKPLEQLASAEGQKIAADTSGQKTETIVNMPYKPARSDRFDEVFMDYLNGEPGKNRSLPNEHQKKIFSHITDSRAAKEAGAILRGSTPVDLYDALERSSREELAQVAADYSMAKAQVLVIKTGDTVTHISASGNNDIESVFRRYVLNKLKNEAMPKGTPKNSVDFSLKTGKNVMVISYSEKPISMLWRREEIPGSSNPRIEYEPTSVEGKVGDELPHRTENNGTNEEPTVTIIDKIAGMVMKISGQNILVNDGRLSERDDRGAVARFFNIGPENGVVALPNSAIQKPLADIGSLVLSSN